MIMYMVIGDIGSCESSTEMKWMDPFIEVPQRELRMVTAYANGHLVGRT